MGEAVEHALEQRAVPFLALTQRLLRPFALADVDLDGDEVGDLAPLVGHRRDRLLLDVQLAVLPPIDHLVLPDAAPKDGLPQLLVEQAVMAARLENSRCPSAAFVQAPSREPGESIVDPEDLSFAVSDHHGVGRGLEGRALQAKARLALAQLGVGHLPLAPPEALGDEAGEGDEGEGERGNEPRVAGQRGDDLLVVHLAHEEPGRVRDTPEGGQHALAAVVPALDDALFPLHGQGRRQV